jgi:hypothetical protein
MQFLMSRLQPSGISCSCFSACINSRGLPTETAGKARRQPFLHGPRGCLGVGVVGDQQPTLMVSKPAKDGFTLNGLFAFLPLL